MRELSGPLSVSLHNTQIRFYNGAALPNEVFNDPQVNGQRRVAFRTQLRPSSPTVQNLLYSAARPKLEFACQRI